MSTHSNTERLIDAKALSKMKPSAIFLNLGRGPIVVEEDLADALESGQIAAAGLDVLCTEPMCATNPLLRIKDSKKLLITPHIAWASVEARTSLMNIILGQISRLEERDRGDVDIASRFTHCSESFLPMPLF